ncbi:MAG: hypothetical protein AAB209_10470 [Bacteroidota bacterium]
MTIDKVGSGRLIVPVSENATIKEKKSEKADSKDRVELSEEAKLLFAAEKAKKLGAIRAKVKKGFYEEPVVTKKVVEGLMRDIKRSPEA